MNKKILLFSISLSFFFIACSDNKKVNTPVTPVKTQQQIPNWILNPDKPNQICSVGNATNNSQAKQKALVKAKANISKQIDIFINNQTNINTQCTNDECKNSYETFTRQQASNMVSNIQVVDTYIDNTNDNYYLRACTIKDDKEFVYKKPSINSASEVTKKACLLQSNYTDISLDEQKKTLVQNAKQKALNELYGELMYSKTDLKNGKLSSDKIRQRAVGAVRTKGEPIFYQGKNLGEICVDVTSYVTKEDLEKYKPKKVNLEHFCFNDRSIAMKDIKQEAKYKAYKEMVAKYKPSLKLTGKEAEQFIHGFTISNDNFDFDKASYCFDAIGTVLPYELELGKKALEGFKDNGLQTGLMATFYEADDYTMKNPIYKTYISSVNLAYKKLPSVSQLKKDKPYYVKITGFVKSNKSKTLPLTMYANVYEAKLFVNDDLVVTDKNNKQSVKLKKGFNKVKLIIKTANSYDVKVVGGLEDIYTNKI